MKMKRGMWLLILGAVLMSGTTVASAQDLKIGVVNLSQLVRQSPQAEHARKQMHEKFSDRKQAIKQKMQALKSDIKRLKRDGGVMSKQARQKLQESIKDQKRLLEIKRSNYKDDVQGAERKLLKDLRKQLADAIQQYAKDFNYDLIVGQGVLYATDSINVTGRLLQRLRAQAQN